MLKSLVVFFRNKAIKKGRLKQRSVIMPDVTNLSAITLLMDPDQYKSTKEIEKVLKTLYQAKKFRYVMYCDLIPNDKLQTDTMVFLTKDDFNIFGIIKKDKLDVINSFENEILINMSEDNELIINDYLQSLINSSFVIGHSKLNKDFHDLTFDYGIEKDVVQRLRILHKYLLMLSGNKNEK